MFLDYRKKGRKQRKKIINEKLECVRQGVGRKKV